MIDSSVTSRRWGLDLLRAIAILSVVEGHGRSISAKIAENLKFIGLTDGVDLFFVLSGFLIGNILIKDHIENKRINIYSFWIRRWLRTLPIYFIALIANFIFMLFVFHYAFDKKDMLLHFGFLQNMIPPYTDHRFFSEAWSLSIEEYFYLCLPLALISISIITKIKNTKTLFILGLLSLISFSFACRMYLFHRMPIENLTLTEWNTRFRIIIPLRLDSLAVGVFAALVRTFFKELWRNKKFIVVCFLIGITGVFLLDRTWIFNGTIPLNFFSCVPYFLLYSIGVSLTLPLLDNWQPRPNLFTRIISWISKLSYSMYLFHNSLIVVPFRNYAHSIPEHPRVQMGLYGLYWILVFTIAYAGYTFIEKPILQYRDRKYL